MDRPRMGKTSAASSLVLAGVPILLGVVLLLPFAAGKEDAITTGPQSSFLYWVLDSSMWAIALYYILTRRAAFIELFQRFILRQDELSAQIDEIELKATELADGYEEITKRLPSIHGTRHNAKLIAILTALDAATRRMLDSLPLPSSPTKDEGAGDSSLSVSREDGEPEVVAPHDIEPAVSTADGGDLDATTESVKELPAALPYTTADAQQGESDQAKASEPEAQNKEPVPHEPQAKDVVEEVSQEKQHNDEHEGSPLEESESENSGLGYTPDSRKTTSTPLANKEDEQEQSEGDEEKTNGSSPGAANAAGASAIRRKRRLRSRRSVKCRAGEYDDTVGEGELLRSGSEPDSDASEHRSSDTSIGIGEPLDPSSQFVNEDMRIGGSPSRHHYRKKKDKKPKMRNLKRSSKKMGRSKEVLHSVFNEENERRGPNESYSEEGDGEAEDQRDKLLRELSQAEGESATQARVDLDDLKAELDGASLSEEYEKDVDEHTTATAPVDEEDEEEDVSDSWRHQKDSDDNSSDEGEEKSDFMKLVEEGDDDDDEQDRSRSRSSSGEDSEQEGGMKTSLDALKDQLAGLDFGDNSGSRPLRSESFTSLQNQLKGLDDLGSFGKLDSLDVTAGGEGEEEWRSRLLDGSEEKDDEEKNPSKPGASPLSSKSGTMKRRSILDVFDNYEGPGEAQKQAASTGERGDGALRAIAAREDINVTGLRRAKKTPSFGSMNRGTKKSIRPQYDMEDAHTVVYPFFEDKGSAFIAVLDGHAGFAVAQEGVKLFPQELKAHLESGKPADHNLADILKQTFASVDAQLTEHEFLGATATVVFVWTEEGKRYLQAANVGDSAAYIRRGNQTVKLTYDHKVTDEAERERLTNMGVELSVGATRINGLAVSRALGDHFMKENQLGLISEPYVSDPIELTDEDTMLIVASDGLWDVTSGEEAMQIVEGMDSVEDMASSLVRTAVSSSLCSDNVTVVVARL